MTTRSAKRNMFEKLVGFWARFFVFRRYAGVWCRIVSDTFEMIIDQ